MDIYEIRELVWESLMSSENHHLFDDVLQDTSPANYGFEVDYVDVAKNDVWVNLPNSFTFKGLDLQFTAQLGASNPEHGFEKDFSKSMSGSGTFKFIGGNKKIAIEEIQVDEGIDLFGGERE